jgi:hypothetical protein
MVHPNTEVKSSPSRYGHHSPDTSLSSFFMVTMPPVASRLNQTWPATRRIGHAQLLDILQSAIDITDDADILDTRRQQPPQEHKQCTN